MFVQFNDRNRDVININNISVVRRKDNLRTIYIFVNDRFLELEYDRLGDLRYDYDRLNELLSVKNIENI